MIKSPDVQKTLAEQGFITIVDSPAEFSQFIQKDIAKWEGVLKTVANANERRHAAMTLHCALLDDYQRIALSIADWSGLSGRVAVRAMHEHYRRPAATRAHDSAIAKSSSRPGNAHRSRIRLLAQLARPALAGDDGNAQRGDRSRGGGAARHHGVRNAWLAGTHGST